MFYTLQRKEKLMPKKIGTDFHMVANDIYQAYDEGKKPQEKDLTELYELSKEFVKDYEEKEKKITYAQITSFTNAFDHTCSDGWITDIVNGEVDIDKLKSFILTHYEEHKDDEGNKVLDEDIEGYFTKDNCSEVFTKTEKGKKKKERQDPIEDEPMCTVCHSSDVYSLSEDDEPYVGHCNECEEDRDLEICELDEKGKVK